MLFTDAAIMLGMVYVYLPLMVLPIYASMEKLDFRLIEAAYDLYATRFQVLRRLILPLVKPGIVAGSILVFIPAIGAYVTPSVLGGGKNMMVANLIELQFGQGRNWPLGAALSIAVMVIVMIALLIYVRNAGRSGSTRAWLKGSPRPRRVAARSPASTSDRQPACFVLLYLPIVVLVVYAFNAANSTVDLGRLFAALVRGGMEQQPRHRGFDTVAPDRLDRRRARHDCCDDGGAGDAHGPPPIAG